MCVCVYVCVWRRSEKSRRERGGGTGVCRDQCMVHTDVSSRRQGCREEKARVSVGRERVGEKEEEGRRVERMTQGFCLRERTCRDEE